MTTPFLYEERASVPTIHCSPCVQRAQRTWFNSLCLDLETFNCSIQPRLVVNRACLFENLIFHFFLLITGISNGLCVSHIFERILTFSSIAMSKYVRKLFLSIFFYSKMFIFVKFIFKISSWISSIICLIANNDVRLF